MARRASPVPDWIPDALPAAPGVYRFLDAAGTRIYIGKSVNLRRRVRGYFYGGGPDDERKRDMLRLARGLEFRRCGSDLEAQLEEADGIATLRPAFNRVHKNRSRGWYIEADRSRPFPRLRVVREARRARARYIGPYRGRRIPQESVALVEKIYRLRTCPGAIRPDPEASPCLQHGIDQCSAPCVGLVGLDGYRAQVGHAVDALLDGETARRHASVLAERLRAAEAAGSNPELLHGLKRRLRWFEELESYRPALHRLPVDRSRLIVLPGADEAEWVLVPVARGRILARSSVDAGGPAWADHVEDACYRVRVEELRAPTAFPVEALTLTLIVDRWLRDRAARPAPEGTAGASARVFDLDRRGADYVIDRLSALRSDGLCRAEAIDTRLRT